MVNMRIAYVGLYLENKIIHGGVGRKIYSQLNIWREAGHEARLFLLTPDANELPDTTVYRFSPPAFLPKPVARPWLEIARSRKLAEMIREILAYRPDMIYLRYGLFTFPLQRLYKEVPVVVELNTLDVQEYRYRGLIFYWLNRLTRGIILRHSAGLVPVSHEIARANQVFGKPFCVIGNGIDLSSFQPPIAPVNAQPRLVFAGTPGLPWHGVDKLVGLAKDQPGLSIDVIGYGPQDLPGSIPGNLTLHGFLSQAAVKQIVANADAALGTLALHRNHMEEASPLKVREALAMGVPVILPYEDTDLSQCNVPFILQLPNNEDNLQKNSGAIYDFACRMMGLRVNRAQVQPFIDQHQKEIDRLAFFEGIIQNSSPERQ